VEWNFRPCYMENIEFAKNIMFPLIKQILYNLLGNAIKFTPNEGEINIHASLEGKMVHISVSEVGTGSNFTFELPGAEGRSSFSG